MRDFTVTQRWIHSVKLCVGLGMLAGGLESLSLSLQMALPVSVIGFVAIGLSAVAVMAVVGGTLAVPIGSIQLLLKPTATYRAMALQVGVVGGVLVGLFLWQGSLELVRRDNPVGAVAMGLMPIGFGGVIYYNARFWLKKVQIGATYKLGFLGVAALTAAVLVAAGAGVRSRRDTGGSYALPNDPNVVFIAMEGLRWDHVGHLGGRADTPRIDRLSKQGVVFANAVTPTPEAGPALATVLTGLHPLRHERISNHHDLHPGARPFSEVVRGEGWATGGFVSSASVGAITGSARGMLSFDDAFGPGFPGFTEVNVSGHLARWLGSQSHRGGGTTVDRFAAWFADHHQVPFFALVHLADPSVAAARGAPPYREAVERTDAQVGRVLDLIEEAGVEAETLVVFIGLHGVLLGEHEGQRGLWDEQVRVPMIIRSVKLNRQVKRVEAQVRLTDVFPTAMAFSKLDETDETEGIDLLGFISGQRTHTIWCSLVGHDGHGALVGLRNNGVKYISRPDHSDEMLFDVNTDPGELHNLIETQAQTLEQARRLVSAERSALKRIRGGPHPHP